MPYEDNVVNLFLNGVRVNGLESLDVNSAPQSEQIEYIGNKGRQEVRSSYPLTKLNISKRYYGADFFLDRFSGDLINAYITLNGQTGNNLAMTSGVMTNYTINLGLNQQPAISCDFEFYNDCGQLNITGAPFIIGQSGYFYLNAAAPTTYEFATQAVIQTGTKQIYKYQENPCYYFKTGDTVFFSGNHVTGITSISNSFSTGHTGYLYRKQTYPIVSSKGIKLDIGDARNNNLIQASINYSFPRLPIYDIGSEYPSAVYPITPTDVYCTLDFEPTSYEIYKQSSWPETPKRNTLNFRLFDISGAYVDNINLGSMELVSEKASVSVDGSLRISAEYKKYNYQEVDYSFDINSLGNQVYVWIDSSDLPNTSYIDSEFAVPILYDKSARAMHFTGTVGNATIPTATKNGKRYLSTTSNSRRYGNDRFLYNPNFDNTTVEWAVYQSGIECLFVVQFTGSASASNHSYLCGIGDNNYLYYGQNFADQAFAGNVGRYLATSNIITTNTSGNYSSWQIIGIRRGGKPSGATPVTGLWNGYNFNAYTTSVSSYDTLSNMRLFGLVGGPFANMYWAGNVGEIIWMSPQPDDTRGRIIKHLAQKWGLQSQINPSL
jgi:hypothetical protein